ncbi:Clp1/GlmU family protein [Chlamydiota bacterium]
MKDTQTQIQPLQNWDKAVQGIIKNPGICIILGATDSGKTSFIQHLSSKVPEALSLGILDADIRKTTVGPPGTLGFTPIKNGTITLPPVLLYFVGSITPTGFMLPFLTGIKKILDVTQPENHHIISIDTTGLIYGDAAKELKFRLIDIISPQHIIALQSNQELENILLPQEKREDTTIWRLKTIPEKMARSMEERQLDRKNQFLTYFKNKKTYSAKLSDVAIIGLHPDFGGKAVSQKEFYKMRLERMLSLKNSLIGINDGHNFTIAVGLLTGVDFDTNAICFEAPEFDPQKMKIIQCSSMRLDSF